LKIAAVSDKIDEKNPNERRERTMKFVSKDRYDMADLLYIMELLRAPDGCPWDRVQTHESIRRNMIEEAYEVVDALDRRHTDDLKEELGDVLMQVVFHARMEEEQGSFDFGDVVDGTCKKLVFRHPFVFGDAQKDDADRAVADWEAQKKIEKAQKSQTDSMRSVPSSFPALIRGSKLQEKAARSGVDWRDAGQALCDVQELVNLLQSGTRTAEEQHRLYGQLLFAAAGAARLSGVEPEAALSHASDDFLTQFARYESGNVLDRAGTPAEMLKAKR
jgi:tetrapyrrole methylase family protein/MazG family protein